MNYQGKRVPTLIKRTVINSRKRRGDVTNVAERTGFSASYVSRVLNGTRSNEFILSTAYKMLRRRIKNSELA